jgi:alpha/beta superfamily hydrolase
MTMLPGPMGDLETLIFEPNLILGVAVLCHPNPLQGGTNGNKVIQTAAKALKKMGYVVFCPNMRGVGLSHGQHDFGQGEVDDMLAVITIAQQMYPNLPLLVGGFSFGGYVACFTATRIAVNQVLLLGPAVGKYPIPAPTVPASTLVIHGESDEVIPLSNVMLWAHEQCLPVLVMPDTTHFFHGRLVQLAQLIQIRLPALSLPNQT